MTTQPTTDPTHGLSVQHADALWDAVAIPGPTEPTFPMQHERVCRAVAGILDELRTPPAVPVSSPPPDQTATGSGREAECELYVLLRKAGEDRHEAQALIDRHRDEVLRRAELRRLAAEAPQPETPNTTRAAVYREVADRLTTDAQQGMQPDWARIYKRDAAVKVREWAEQLDGEGRQGDTTPRPVQHAPGKAVLCPDCLTKGHAVCMPDEQPPAHVDGNADDCPACQAQGLHTIGHPYECPGSEK